MRNKNMGRGEERTSCPRQNNRLKEDIQFCKTDALKTHSDQFVRVLITAPGTK